MSCATSRRRSLSTRFSRGRSTPEIRAIPRVPPGGGRSALPLLVTGVGADHHDDAVTPDGLALFTDPLDRRLDFHLFFLLVAIGDPSSVQVIGRELDDHAVAGEDADVVHAHLP